MNQGFSKKEIKITDSRLNTVMGCIKLSLSKNTLWLELHCPQGDGETAETMVLHKDLFALTLRIASVPPKMSLCNMGYKLLRRYSLQYVPFPD